MWFVTILYIVIFILIFLCVLYACQSCEGSRLNVYAQLVWTWVLTLFLFAVFGVFIADQKDQMLYMAGVTSISGLFIFFIVLWAIVDAYGFAMQNHKHLHALMCKLDGRSYSPNHTKNYILK